MEAVCEPGLFVKRSQIPVSHHMVINPLGQSHDIAQNHQTTASPKADAAQVDVSHEENSDTLGGLRTLQTRRKASPVKLFNAVAADPAPRDAVSLFRTSKATTDKLNELMNQTRDAVPPRNELVKKIDDCSGLADVEALIDSIASLPLDLQIQALRAVIRQLASHPDDPHQLQTIRSTTNAIGHLPSSCIENNFAELGKVYQSVLPKLDNSEHCWQCFLSGHQAFQLIPKIRTVGTFTALQMVVRRLEPQNRHIAFSMLLAARHLGSKSSAGIALRQLTFTIDSFPEEHFLDALDTLIQEGGNHSRQVLCRMLSDGLLHSVCPIEHPPRIGDDLRVSGFTRILDVAFTLSQEDIHKKGQFGESSLSERLHETAKVLPDRVRNPTLARLERLGLPNAKE